LRDAADTIPWLRVLLAITSGHPMNRPARSGLPPARFVPATNRSVPSADEQDVGERLFEPERARYLSRCGAVIGNAAPRYYFPITAFHLSGDSQRRNVQRRYEERESQNHNRRPFPSGDQSLSTRGRRVWFDFTLNREFRKDTKTSYFQRRSGRSTVRQRRPRSAASQTLVSIESVTYLQTQPTPRYPGGGGVLAGSHAPGRSRPYHGGKPLTIKCLPAN